MILLKFCWILIVANALTIGGGYVMLPMLQKEFVEKIVIVEALFVLARITRYYKGYFHKLSNLLIRRCF